MRSCCIFYAFVSKFRSYANLSTCCVVSRNWIIRYSQHCFPWTAINISTSDIMRSCCIFYAFVGEFIAYANLSTCCVVLRNWIISYSQHGFPCTAIRICTRDIINSWAIFYIFVCIFISYANLSACGVVLCNWIISYGQHGFPCTAIRICTRDVINSWAIFYIFVSIFISYANLSTCGVVWSNWINGYNCWTSNINCTTRCSICCYNIITSCGKCCPNKCSTSS